MDSIDRKFPAVSEERAASGYIQPNESGLKDVYRRVANGIGTDTDHAQRLYDYSGKRHWLSWSSPITSNAGTSRDNSLISCYLQSVCDSIDDITDKIKEYGLLSVRGGGVAAEFSSVRCKGSPTSKGVSSPGLIPFLKVFDSAALGFRQGNRRGAFASYLSISHPEILEFLSIRKAGKGDINRKCMNSHHAVIIPDRFMELVKGIKNGTLPQSTQWDLIDPHSTKVMARVKVIELWKDILQARGTTGEPYILFIDRVQEFNPLAVSHPVKSSNLCFSGDTLVAVADGRNAVTIKELSESATTFPVYCQRESRRNNGSWKKVPEVKDAVAFKTGVQKTIIVELSDGSTFVCTPDHELALANTTQYVKAKDALGMQLNNINTYASGKKWRKINSIDDGHAFQHRLIWEHRHGSLPSGYQIDHVNNLVIDDSLNNLQLLSKREHINKMSEERTGKNNPCFTLTHEQRSIKTQISSNGVLNPRHNGYSNDELVQYTRIAIEHGYTYSDLIECLAFPKTFSQYRFNGNRALFRQLVADPSMEVSEEYNKLPVSVIENYQTSMQPIDKFDHPSMLTVVSITEGSEQDVYDLTVDDNHNFYILTNIDAEDNRIASGVLVHNCSEVTLHTSETESAVCCLASVNMLYWDEFKDDDKFWDDAIEALDNVLDIHAKHNQEIPSIINAIENSRDVGIGMLGLHSYFQSKHIPMDSPLARSTHIAIATKFQEQCVRASERLAEKRGISPRCELAGLKRRNLHVTAVAPNATTAIIMANVSPGIEPRRSNVYDQQTSAGIVPQRNPALKYFLKERDISPEARADIYHEIKMNGGSVQGVDALDDIMDDYDRDVFKSAEEMSQYRLSEFNGLRQAAMDSVGGAQAQSFNLFFNSETTLEEAHNAHMVAWESGAKSLYYIRNTAPRTEGSSGAVGDDTECESCGS